MRYFGIDAGGTLTKLVYEEHGRYHYKVFDSKELPQVMNWIGLTSPDSTLFLTGGKAEKMKTLHPVSTVFPEFDSIEEGMRILVHTQNGKLDRYILVNIGTGTSFFKVAPNDFSRVTGSGMGGGMFMGLGALLSGTDDFHELVELAENGNREAVDLMVKDIYEGDETPVPDYLTAANFAKVRLGEASRKDVIRSLTNLIAETVILLAHQLAASHQCQKLVFIGSTLLANSPLKEDLKQFEKFLGYQCIFIENGSFSGSIGALRLGLKSLGISQNSH
ncbi:type II pantothenate kinase [Rossellomorea aquimaris]|uniref:Pantothenate kinase n=1 Tax=Rossellomorea aquimaris TaxID=189382 RepID=A0A1J6WJS6_9BACI|nr:type II pantothenate kinase [Rossellomorea aquimaris]OIU72072.1 hypothetical protein BHE18_05410 [Rossellomorea aquimaris]